jgi:hypothetical protein
LEEERVARACKGARWVRLEDGADGTPDHAYSDDLRLRSVNVVDGVDIVLEPTMMSEGQLRSNRRDPDDGLVAVLIRGPAWGEI